MSTPGNLTADVEGDIEEVDGVLRITHIRLTFRFAAPTDQHDSIRRVLGVFADKCPAYQSVRGCIDVTWDADMTDAASA